MSEYEGIAGRIGEQRARFVEAYGIEPNRVGIPANMLRGNKVPVEIMGMRVRLIDWPGAQAVVWREVCDPHEGMMTRREVLELIGREWRLYEGYLRVHGGVAGIKHQRAWRQCFIASPAIRSEAWGAIGALARALGWPPHPPQVARDAAHELALIEHAEREEGSV